MRLAALIAALLSCVLSADERPRLIVQTPGRFAFAPADWWVRVKVDPRPEHRWLEIIMDGDEHYRFTGFDLDGEQAAYIHTVWMKALPAGCYQISATVRATGEHGTVLAKAQGRELSVRGVTTEGDPCGGTEPRWLPDARWLFGLWEPTVLATLAIDPHLSRPPAF